MEYAIITSNNHSNDLLHVMLFILLVTLWPFSAAAYLRNSSIIATMPCDSDNGNPFFNFQNLTMKKYIGDSVLNSSSPFYNVQVGKFDENEPIQINRQDDESLSQKRILRVMLPPRDSDQSLCGTNFSNIQFSNYHGKETDEFESMHTAIALLLIDPTDNSVDCRLRARLDNFVILNSQLSNNLSIIKYLIIPLSAESRKTYLATNDYTTNVTIIYMQSDDFHEIRRSIEQRGKSGLDGNPYLFEEGNDDWAYDFILTDNDDLVDDKNLKECNNNYIGIAAILIQVFVFGMILICCIRAHFRYQEEQEIQYQQRLTNMARGIEQSLQNSNKKKGRVLITSDEFDQLPTIKYKQLPDLLLLANEKTSSTTSRTLHKVNNEDIDMTVSSDGSESETYNDTSHQIHEECDVEALTRHDDDNTGNADYSTEESLPISYNSSCTEVIGACTSPLPPLLMQDGNDTKKCTSIKCSNTSSTSVVLFSHDNTCSICIDEFTGDDDVIILPRCKHMYHKNCIREWLLDMKGCSCPICKTPVSP